VTPPPATDDTVTALEAFPNSNTSPSPDVTACAKVTVSWEPDAASDEEFCTAVMTEARGETALTELGDVTVNEDAGTVPNFTAVAPEKFAPDIVTEVPPDIGPEDGLAALTDGGEPAELV
jgi:hypothetical protein